MGRMQIRGPGVFSLSECINSVGVEAECGERKIRGQPRESSNAETRLARARGVTTPSVAFTGAKAEAYSRRREGAGEE